MLDEGEQESIRVCFVPGEPPACKTSNSIQIAWIHGPHFEYLHMRAHCYTQLVILVYDDTPKSARSNSKNARVQLKKRGVSISLSDYVVESASTALDSVEIC